MLKANGIAPISEGQKRPAASQTESVDVKPEIIDIEDGNDEIKALEVSRRFSFGTYVIKLLGVLQNRLNVLKSRRSNSNSNPPKRVKREPRNSGFFVPGEVIDLT